MTNETPAVLPDGTLSPQAFLEVSQGVAMFAALVLTAPLEEYLKTLDRADLLGPVSDPKAWEAGRAEAMESRMLAKKLLEFQRYVQQRLAGEGVQLP